MKKIVAKIAQEGNFLIGDEAKSESSFLESLALDYPSVKVNRYFSSLEPDQMRELVKRAVENSPDYTPPDFLSYVEIELPDDIDSEEFLERLNSSALVESAHLAPKGINPAVNPGDDPKSKNQGYLEPAPVGIDAKYAWTVPGGDGAGQKAIDLERGWTFEHEDLIAHNIKLLRGVNEETSRWHGTCVLGVLCAVDNNKGCVGIAPNIASVNVVSYVNSSNNGKIGDAITVAAYHLAKGEFLILEVQDDNEYPIEVGDDEFNAIQLATAAGIIVIEAAGNKGANLDDFTNQAGRQILNRDSRDFRDSGAIMVSGSTSGIPHRRISEVNYGNRVDCFAWGENIYTCISQNKNHTNGYTDNFNHTSGATPIVAGAAICIQGICEAKSNRKLSPTEMRSILTDRTVNTLSANPSRDRIGVMPDLKSIIQKYFV